jgi:diguanylate cyclase (GGDEF)-like protein
VTLIRTTSGPARLGAGFAVFTAVWFGWSALAAGGGTGTAERWVGAVLYVGLAGGLAAACLATAVRQRSARWGSEGTRWPDPGIALAVLALAVFAAGDVLWYLSDLGAADLGFDTAPSLLAYVPAYVALLAAITTLLVRHGAVHSGRLLEACITGGGAAAAAAPFIILPFTDGLTAETSLDRFAYTTYLVIDVLLAAACAAATLTPTAPVAVRLLGVAAGICVVADQVWAVRALNGDLTAPPWLDWLRLGQYTLMAAAVLRRQGSVEPTAARDSGARLARRVTVLVVCALLSSVLLVLVHFNAPPWLDRDKTETMYVVATLALVTLLCARLVQLLDENAATVRELRESLAERQQLSSDLEHQSRHDVVTGLPNRYQLADQAEAVLEADFVLETMLDGADTSHAVVFIDLDDFKAVNDTLGHTVGDRVLREIALRLKRVCRPDDLVARLGGDEFAVLLPGSTTDEAADIARRMIRVLAEPVVVGGRRITLGASAGVAQMQRGHGKYADALAEADVAMYAAKRAGKNRVAVFAETMRRDLLGDASLAADLQRALRDRTLSVAYQPLVHLATGRTEGLEALARWRHPERGELSPAVFLPIATERGLVPDLDMSILDLALDQATVWRHMAPDLFVGVNAAAATLAQEDFTATVLEKLDRAGLPGEALVVEVTEQSIIDDVPGAAAKLDELRRHGIAIALDDFGTGYSSLSALQDLPVDKLKLDRSFLARGVTNGVVSPLLRTVVTLGHELGMAVVAEGIETQEHFEAMRELGCDVGQGWLLSRPMPPEDVFRHLSTPSVAAPIL